MARRINGLFAALKLRRKTKQFSVHLSGKRKTSLTPSSKLTALGCGRKLFEMLRECVLEVNEMSDQHLRFVENVVPSADGCEECLKMGSSWVQLRLCLTCGHVGCCDSSPNRHGTKHFHQTGHPIIQSFERGENWRWCYVDPTEV